MGLANTYIRYGVSNEIAIELEKKNISATTFRSTSEKNLIEKYELESTIVSFVKDCLTREEISENIIQELLEKSNFVCCVCKGKKSDGYIIHHIVEYFKTQDNSYNNLAVLCPNDHDIAHRQGIALTNKLTENQIRICKENWEAEVTKTNTLRAQQNQTEFDRIDETKITFLSETVIDAEAKTLNCNHTITNRTTLVLKVTQAKPEQEFIVYLSVITDQNEHKWIGFGTPQAIKNVFSSERVYRIGKPGKLKYNTVEHLVERIDESGLTLKGRPKLIDKVRFWGWHNNSDRILFEYALLD